MQTGSFFGSLSIGKDEEILESGPRIKSVQVK